LDLAITTSQRGACIVVALAGDIDMQTAPQLQERLVEFANDDLTVVVDLNGVEFLDSSGLGALVGATNALQQAGGSLRLACPRPHVRKVLRISRIGDVIPIYDGVEDACVRDS
jgi:anti-sigma B factor antagonist